MAPMSPSRSYTLIYKVKPPQSHNHISSQNTSRSWHSSLSNFSLVTDTERILLDHQSSQWRWQVARRLSIVLIAVVDMIISYWRSQQDSIALPVARLVVGPLILTWTWSLANVLLVIWQHTVIRPAVNSVMDFLAWGGLVTMCVEASFELVGAVLLGYYEDGYWSNTGQHRPVHLTIIRSTHWAMYALLLTVTLLQTVEMVVSCFGLRTKKKKKKKESNVVVTTKSHGSSNAREGGEHYGPIGRDFGVTY